VFHQNFDISLEAIQDIRTHINTYDSWRYMIEKNSEYINSGEEKLVMDHPVIEKFKFFATSPTGLSFFLDKEKKKMDREVFLCYRKKLDDDLIIKPQYDALYYISEINGEYYIRMGTSQFERVL